MKGGLSMTELEFEKARKNGEWGILANYFWLNLLTTKGTELKRIRARWDSLTSDEKDACERA